MSEESFDIDNQIRESNRKLREKYKEEKIDAELINEMIEKFQREINILELCISNLKLQLIINGTREKVK